MQFGFNIYSSLLLIFFVHGFVYAFLLYLKSRRNETASDRWLSIFLLLCTLYIMPWMLGFAGWYDSLPYRNILFYTPFQHLFFMGPVIFFYVQSLLNPHFRFGRKHWVHFLPGLLYLVYSAVAFLVDRVVLNRPVFLADGIDPDFATWYQVAGHFAMLVYFLLSLRYYRLFRRLMMHVISYADRMTFFWVRDFLIAFLLMLVLRCGFLITSLFVDRDYWSSWWYFLLFAIIFYYIAITGHSNSVKARIPFISNLRTSRTVLVLSPSRPLHLPAPAEEELVEIEIVDSPTREEEDELVTLWKPRLMAVMKDEKMYENQELSLPVLAARLDTNTMTLSKTINRGFGQNFNDFVNQFRIDAVKARLDQGEFTRQTLVGIAYDCGFNSKATFNRAFKKVTGITPSEYLKQVKARMGMQA